MNLQSKPQKVWTKPELKRIGKISDVAGSKGSGTQAGPNSRS